MCLKSKIKTVDLMSNLKHISTFTFYFYKTKEGELKK